MNQPAEDALIAKIRKLPAEEITGAEMQEIVDVVREVRAKNRAERERAGRP